MALILVRIEGVTMVVYTPAALPERKNAKKHNNIAKSSLVY